MTQQESSKSASSSSWPGQSRRQPPHWWQTPRGKTVVVLGVVILGVIIWTASRGPGKDKSAADQVVPIVTATAHQGTFVVYQSEPGTVTPTNSVLVRSRVDGQLMSVAFTGGQMVKKGDLLAEIDPRPLQAQLETANGDLVRSQAQLTNAQETLKHYQALLAQNSIAPQRVSDQQSLTRQYAAEVTANQSRITSANLQLSNARITSPISGMVGLRQVDPGNLVGPSDARGLTVVTQSQPSKVVFAVPVAVIPSVLERLRGGDCIPVDAYGDSPDDVLGSGHLLAANNQVDPATGTVRLEAEFANAQGSLLPNQFVTARLPVAVLPQATLVPSAAIQQGATGPFVYVIGNDATAAVVPVKVGPSDATNTVIKSGLAPGAKIVVEGADRLRAGSRVNATAAAPAATAAAAIPQCSRDDAHGPQKVAAQGATSGAAGGRRLDSIARS